MENAADGSEMKMDSGNQQWRETAGVATDRQQSNNLDVPSIRQSMDSSRMKQTADGASEQMLKWRQDQQRQVGTVH